MKRFLDPYYSKWFLRMGVFTLKEVCLEIFPLFRGVQLINLVYFFYADQIDCGSEKLCNLSWLNRYESGVKLSLICSNGTSFQDLHSSGFNHCPHINS